jgi:hypothetical protein
MGDAIGAGVVEHLSKRDLNILDKMDAADIENPDVVEQTTKHNSGLENKAFTSTETTKL